MTGIPESDTVITTTDGRARLDVEKLFEKEHVKKRLEEMRRKIRESAAMEPVPRIVLESREAG